MDLISTIILLYSGIGVNIALVTLAPFFPTMLAQKNIDPVFNGVVFSGFSLPYIFSPYILSRCLLPKLGHINTFVLGCCLLGVGMWLFAIIDFITSKPLFVIAGLITRIIEGAGSAFIFGASTSILSIAFSTTLARYMTIYQACLGFGKMVGPLFGATFFKIGGYRLPFIIVGLINFSSIALKWSSRGENWLESSIIENSEEEEENRPSSWEILRIPRAHYALLNQFIVIMLHTITESNLPTKLSQSFAFDQGQIAYCLLLINIPCAFFCLIFLCLPAYLERMPIMLMSYFMGVLSLLLIGPFKVLNIPETQEIVFLGMMLLGMSLANGSAFVTPETVMAASSKYPEGYAFIANSVSGLRNLMYGLGQIVGALFGSLLIKAIGFVGTLEVISILCVLMAVYGALLMIRNKEATKKECNEVRGQADDEIAPLISYQEEET